MSREVWLVILNFVRFLELWAMDNLLDLGHEANIRNREKTIHVFFKYCVWEKKHSCCLLILQYLGEKPFMLSFNTAVSGRKTIHHLLIPYLGEKPVMSSFNTVSRRKTIHVVIEKCICPEACCQVGERITPPPSSPPYFSANPWIFHLKTT